MKACLFITPFIFLLSCGRKDDSATPNEYAARFIRALNTSGTFLFNFFYDKNGGIDTARLARVVEYENKMNLQHLENGFDSVLISIELGYSLGVRNKLVILKQDKKKWTAEISEINNRFNKKTEQIDSSWLRTEYAFPKSGWVKLINNLFDLKLLSLEDSDKLAGYSPHVMDGCWVSVGIATKNYYRVYGFKDPELLAENFWQAKNADSIRSLLYAEFSCLKKWDNEYEEAVKIATQQAKKRSDTFKQSEIFIKDVDSKDRHKKPELRKKGSVIIVN